MIKLLDENTIKNIAAGEVIENPSNVVKELIENSIDANAKSIIVDIKEGGLSHIKIQDDGDGFLKEDIENAFLLHATSKITNVDDLYKIDSYGFRGEALSSIASVSNVTLITKHKTSNENFGYSININFGIKNEIVKIPSTKGSTIIINDLFSNQPVRKKFLKSENIEAAKVEEIVEKFALSNKDVAFKFIKDDKIKFSTKGDGNLKDIIYLIYGKNVYDNLLYVNGENEKISVNGFVVNPSIARNKRDDEIYFVNNRYVKSDVIRRAIENSYEGFLMQHKYPLVVLNIFVKKDEIDINIHPKKLEVRFSNDDIVYFMIYDIIKNVLNNTELINDEKIFVKNDDKIYDYPLNEEENTYEILEDIVNNDDNKTFKSASNIENCDTKKEVNYLELDTLKNVLNSSLNSSIDIEKLKIATKNPIVEEKKFIDIDLANNNRYIGQIFKTYILVEYNDKLYIIDQHAAHEKIYYEKLIRNYNNKEIVSEKLLESVVIKLTPMQYEYLLENLTILKDFGYEIEPFGDSDLKIDAVPFDIPNVNRKELLLEIIDEFTNVNNKIVYKSIEDKIATISCKKAVKGNNALNEVEAKKLLEELFKLQNPYNCPHGRPTIISITKDEFEKKFGRIVF